MAKKNTNTNNVEADITSASATLDVTSASATLDVTSASATLDVTEPTGNKVKAAAPEITGYDDETIYHVVIKPSVNVSLNVNVGGTSGVLALNKEVRKLKGKFLNVAYLKALINEGAIEVLS